MLTFGRFAAPIFIGDHLIVSIGRLRVVYPIFIRVLPDRYLVLFADSCRMQLLQLPPAFILYGNGTFQPMGSA